MSTAVKKATGNSASTGVEAAFLRELAAAAAAETLPRFRQAAQVTNKLAIGFDPVTEADRAAEQAMRALISSRFPEHGIVGEEFGSFEADRRFVWVLDPVDGTRAFITGLPVWGSLAGLMEDGKAIAGMMAQPFTRELFIATGQGAFHEEPHGHHVLRAADTKELAAASLFTTSPHLFAGEKLAALHRLQDKVRFTRYGCDCYAFAMLAAGHVDLVIESGLKPHDIVALIPVVEQAGGVITRWDGGRAEAGGDVIAAATRDLWEKARKILQGG